MEALPEDLDHVLKRFLAGHLQVDARALLEALPRWQGLKEKAEQNNHRQDATSRTDKVLRQVQQKVLGLMKVYVALHQGLDMGEPQELGQQFFALLLELEDWCLQRRKEGSLPGSVKKHEPQLFTPDDLKHSAEVERINRAGSTPFFAIRRPVSCFTTSTGYRGVKYRGKRKRLWMGKKRSLSEALQFWVQFLQETRCISQGKRQVTELPNQRARK